MVEVRYDFLGCKNCFPAVAIDALNQSRGAQEIVAACPTTPVEARAGWPPLPGAYTVLAAADTVLALAASVWAVLLGAGLWGLHMGMTQDILATVVAESTPPSLRGTAFGLFYLLTGVTLFVASLLVGWLWSTLGPAATFGAGALLTVLALLSLIILAMARPAAPRRANG